MEVPEGKRLATTGPDGAGKVLLLATAGLWQEGEGRIRRPGPGEVMYHDMQLELHEDGSWQLDSLRE